MVKLQCEQDEYDQYTLRRRATFEEEPHQLALHSAIKLDQIAVRDLLRL